METFFGVLCGPLGLTRDLASGLLSRLTLRTFHSSKFDMEVERGPLSDY